MFPKWTNGLRMGLAAGALIVPTYAVILFAYGASPRALDAGYQPLQPVPYSHALHAGKLGLDCRYCHINVEYAAHAMIPPTQTCINCHHAILPASAKLVKIKESWETGKPVEWVRVHDLPDFVYFDHSAHVRRGVGCVSCHGRIDRMEVVYQHEPLSMGWCLDCHREPEKHLRPLDKITDMAWQPPEDALVFGKRLREAHSINPSTDCSTCHR